MAGPSSTTSFKKESILIPNQKKRRFSLFHQKTHFSPEKE
jgi:hypothetical protein